MTPYRTPAAAPAAPPRPTWRRRLAATLLPARCRGGRAARGGHWETSKHVRGGVVARVYPWQRMHPCTLHALPTDECTRFVECEDHGPPVAPLRWRRTRAGRFFRTLAALHVAMLPVWFVRHAWAAAVTGALSLPWCLWWSAQREREALERSRR